MLPPFNTLGNLPENMYRCSKSEMHARLVAQFPGSTERQSIYDGYCALHQKLEGLGVNATQWVNGSYTTRKLDPLDQSIELDPGDIDVLTFIDYDYANSLPPAAQLLLKTLIAGGEATKGKYRTHTIALTSCLPGHPYYAAFEQQRKWYRDIFSRHSPPSTRPANSLALPYPVNGPRKGILEIVVGSPGRAPQIDGAR